MEQVIIATGTWDNKRKWVTNTAEVNELLEQGWKIVSASPMGAYGHAGNDTSKGTALADNGFASLLVLKRTTRKDKKSTVRKRD